MGTVGDRDIRAEGTPEATWQTWGGLARVHRTSAGALVAEGGRAVVIAPHPDDEILAAAGLMSQLDAAGRDVVVVAVTDGSASHPGSARWTPSALAARRVEERRIAMCRLGLGHIPITPLGLPDGAVAQHENELRDWLHTIVREGDTLFATWQLDGHPDHEAVGRIAAVCARDAGLPLVELPVWMWHWATPGERRIPWERARAVSLTPAQHARKCDAIAAHATQLEADPSMHAPPILPPWALERLLRDTEIVFV